ncbi:MAG: hypothetical protein O4M80_05955, partial [Buchnera aphidicola]|nr:hypothetical protein [Buchnera aphidicola]
MHFRDEFWEIKQKRKNVTEKQNLNDIVYEEIHMPKNTGLGFFISILSLLFGFAAVWHITWLCS